MAMTLSFPQSTHSMFLANRHDICINRLICKVRLKRFLQMRSLPIFLLLLMLRLFTSSPALAVETSAADPVVAREILARADRIRFPDTGFQVDVTITTSEPNADDDVRTYRIISKGNTQTLVQTTAPAIDQGQILLMRDRDLWVFLPNLSQPIRLPLSQKLTGQVSNGDLARANFVGDYEPKLLRTEKIDGVPYQVLQLDAVDNGVTYRQVLYWVNSKNHQPYKAEFYALSGRLLKTGHYQEYRALGGETRPTRLVIEDAMRRGHRSVLEYRDMVMRDLPDKIFTKDYLKKLSR